MTGQWAPWAAEGVQLAGDVSGFQPDPHAMAEAGWGAGSDSQTPDWIPWCRDHGVLLVAVSQPVTMELHRAVLDSTGESRVGFLSADPQQIRDAQTQLRPWLVNQAAEGFADLTPNFSAKKGVRRWQAALPALAAILIVAAAILDWRALVVVFFAMGSVSFLISSMYKVVATFLSPVRRFQERGSSRTRV